MKVIHSKANSNLLRGSEFYFSTFRMEIFCWNTGTLEQCPFMSSNTSKVTISKAEPCGEPLCGGETTNGELKCVSTAMEFRWFGCVEVCVVRSVPVLGLKFFWGVHAGTIIIFIVVGGGDFSCQSSNSLY